MIPPAPPHARILATLAAAGILAALGACQDAQSPHSVLGDTEPSAEGGVSGHEPQVREPAEKHSCGDHGH